MRRQRHARGRAVRREPLQRRVPDHRHRPSARRSARVRRLPRGRCSVQTWWRQRQKENMPATASRGHGGSATATSPPQVGAGLRCGARRAADGAARRPRARLHVRDRGAGGRSAAHPDTWFEFVFFDGLVALDEAGRIRFRATAKNTTEKVEGLFWAIAHRHDRAPDLVAGLDDDPVLRFRQPRPGPRRPRQHEVLATIGPFAGDPNSAGVFATAGGNWPSR